MDIWTISTFQLLRMLPDNKPSYLLLANFDFSIIENNATLQTFICFLWGSVSVLLLPLLLLLLLVMIMVMMMDGSDDDDYGGGGDAAAAFSV